MNTKIKVYIELELIAEGNVNWGCKERGPSYSSGGEPAEDPEIEDFFLGLYNKETKQYIDLESFINKKEIEQIKEDLFERSKDNLETPTYERY